LPSNYLLVNLNQYKDINISFIFINCKLDFIDFIDFNERYDEYRMSNIFTCKYCLKLLFFCTKFCNSINFKKIYE